MKEDISDLIIVETNKDLFKIWDDYFSKIFKIKIFNSLENVLENKKIFNNDTIFIIQITKQARPISGWLARIAPNAVATPLPPLNFSQIGKTWPKTVKNPAISAKSLPYSLATKTVAAPFPQSSKSVATAIPLRPVRKTLVAPMFPEPIFLISIFKKNLDKMNPNGIEPNK